MDDSPENRRRDTHPLPVGVILAGGLGRRMGGTDKPLLNIAGKTMLGRVVTRLAPQVTRIVVNANGDPGRFTSYGLPIVPDTVEGFAGPLAGILAGMRWAQATLPEARHIVSVAGDTPFFPDDLVVRLRERSTDEGETIALAASGDGTHPVFGLWPISLAGELEQFLRTGTSGKILHFVDRYHRVEVAFEDRKLGSESVDPFFNVNTPEDAVRAVGIATELDSMAGRGSE